MQFMSFSGLQVEQDPYEESSAEQPPFTGSRTDVFARKALAVLKFSSFLKFMYLPFFQYEWGLAVVRDPSIPNTLDIFGETG